MDGMMGFMLQMAGLPAPLIADINSVTPSISKLVEIEKQLGPIFAKSQPLSAHIAQATPILEQALPDILAVLPVAKGLADFALSKAG